MQLFKNIILALGVSALFANAGLTHEEHTPPTKKWDAHLSYKQNSIHMHASFPTPPSVGKESTLILEIKNAHTHQDLEIDDNIEVVLWMPSMNHGSAPTQVERILDENGDVLPGKYLVRNIHFIMGGDWQIQITLTDLNGISETQSFDLMLAGGRHGGHSGH